MQGISPEQYNGIKFADPYIWGISAIRTILSRQEYLGHTVLRESRSAPILNCIRERLPMKMSSMCFINTHEPIISQELWDSVQKRKKRVNRAAARGTHTNRLSGYLYCADCGRRMTLQTHYSKKTVLFSILTVAAGMQTGLISVLPIRLVLIMLKP